MSILQLPSRQYATLKALDPLPIADIAYKRAFGLNCYYLTPHKLMQMYGLKSRYADNLDMQDLAIRVQKSQHLYLTDLGDINSIATTIARLEEVIENDEQTDNTLQAFLDVMRYFEPYAINSGGVKWWGYPTPEYFDYITSVKKIYPKLDEANRFFDRFEAQLKINPETDVPKPKTTFTSRPTGIFTFSRVAPTLYAFPCYKVNETDDDCVKPSSVIRRDDRYFLADAPDVEVGIYGYERREDGSGKFRTQAKKVYATKENKLKITPYINIYVNVGAPNTIAANDYRYNSFAAIALAKLLTDNGFKVSITTIWITRDTYLLAKHTYPYDKKDPILRASIDGTSRHEAFYVSKFSAKSYNELLDFNTALIYGGDPSFFRYDMFRCAIETAYAWNRTMNSGLGYSVVSEDTIDKILERYNINNIQNETRVVISGRFSETSAADAVRTKLAELRLLYGSRQ